MPKPGLSASLLIALAVVGVGLGSCGEADEAPSVDTAGLAASGSSAEELRCPKPAVRNSVVTFLRAASTGSRADVKAALAEPARFRVLSHSLNYGPKPKRFFSSKSRRRVVRHLLSRQARGDRMRLRKLDFIDYDRQFEFCEFGYTIVRRIADGPWRRFVGKGASDQPSGRIALWNTGQSGRL